MNLNAILILVFFMYLWGQMKLDISDVIDLPKKPRLEKSEARSSPNPAQPSKDLPIPDLSSFDETNADDFAMEMGLACVVCR